MPKEYPAEQQYNPWCNLDGDAPDKLAKRPRLKSEPHEEDDIFSDAHVDVADRLSDKKEHGRVMKTTKKESSSRTSKEFGTAGLKVPGTMESSATLNPLMQAQTSAEMTPSNETSQSSCHEDLSPTPSLDLDTESRPVVYIAESPVLFHSPQPRLVTPKLPWYAPQRLLLPFQFLAGTVILIILIIIMLKVFGVISSTETRTETYRPIPSSKVIGSATATMFIDAIEVATVTVTATLPPGRTTAAENLGLMPTAAARARPVERISKDLVAGVGAPIRMNGSSLALAVGIGIWVLG